MMKDNLLISYLDYYNETNTEKYDEDIWNIINYVKTFKK